MTPWLVAETAVVGLVARPTCDAPAPKLSKKTRSPRRMSERETAEPMAYCAKLECGAAMPARASAHMVRPEQSNASGPAAPEA